MTGAKLPDFVSTVGWFNCLGRPLCLIWAAIVFGPTPGFLFHSSCMQLTIVSRYCAPCTALVNRVQATLHLCMQAIASHFNSALSYAMSQADARVCIVMSRALWNLCIQCILQCVCIMHFTNLSPVRLSSPVALSLACLKIHYTELHSMHCTFYYLHFWTPAGLFTSSGGCTLLKPPPPYCLLSFWDISLTINSNVNNLRNM